MVARNPIGIFDSLSAFDLVDLCEKTGSSREHREHESTQSLRIAKIAKRNWLDQNHERFWKKRMPNMWQSSISMEYLEYDSTEDLRRLWGEALVGTSTSLSMLARAYRNSDHIVSPLVSSDQLVCTKSLQLSSINTSSYADNFNFNADLVWQDQCVRPIIQKFAMNIGRAKNSGCSQKLDGHPNSVEKFKLNTMSDSDC